MDKKTPKILFKEFIWLVAIIGISALIEFAIIENFNLHPVLSIKIQVLIGLVIIGYIIRMSGRLWKNLGSSDDSSTGEFGSSDTNDT